MSFMTPTTRSLAAIGTAVTLAVTLPAGPTQAAETGRGDMSAQNSWRPAKKNAIVHFTVGLKRRDSAAIDQVGAVSNPKSDEYRQFLSRAAIRRDYGATSKSWSALRRSAENANLKASLDRTGVFATVSGRSADMSDWLGKPVKYRVLAGEGLAIEKFRSLGSLPQSVSSKVRELVAWDFKTEADPQAQSTALPPYEGLNEGTPVSCYPETDPANPELATRYVYGYNQLRTAYGIDKLPDGAAVARNARVAIMSLEEGFTDVALKASAECFEVGRSTFRRRPVQGLRTVLPQGDEGQLDVQTVQAVLPAGSKVDVIEQSPVDGRWQLAWATAFGLARLPDVISVSYGICEQEIENELQGISKSLSEAVLQRLALAGTSVFVAAGDQGSSGCVVNNGSGEGNKKLAVGYPGSSPFVTSVGGTRVILDSQNRRTGEWVWNSAPSLPPVGPLLGAGGGGTSRWFDRPWWQPKSTTKSTSRTVPDVSAHAAPGPNWPLVESAGGAPEFSAVGGTSAATPFTAAAVGIMTASERKKGNPSIGAFQPYLYRLSGTHPEAFYDVVDGSNDLYDQGCCSAKPGYDKASGIGSPNFATWLEHLPAPAD